MNFQNSAYDGVRGIGGDTAYREFINSGDRPSATAFAQSVATAIQAVRGRAYTVEPSFSLYPTAGASDDYSFSRHFADSSKGKIIAYTLEWGSPANATPLHPPYSEMQNIIQEVTAGLIQFCVDVQAAQLDCFFMVLMLALEKANVQRLAAGRLKAR